MHGKNRWGCFCTGVGTRRSASGKLSASRAVERDMNMTHDERFSIFRGTDCNLGAVASTLVVWASRFRTHRESRQEDRAAAERDGSAPRAAAPLQLQLDIHCWRCQFCRKRVVQHQLKTTHGDNFEELSSGSVPQCEEFGGCSVCTSRRTMDTCWASVALMLANVGTASLM